MMNKNSISLTASSEANFTFVEGETYVFSVYG